MAYPLKQYRYGKSENNIQKEKKQQSLLERLYQARHENEKREKFPDCVPEKKQQ